MADEGGGHVTVRKLTEEEQAQLAQDLETVKARCDEYGFLIRLPLEEGWQGGVEPMLFGAGRLHVFRDAELGKSSPKIYDFERAFEAFCELCELSVDPDYELKGWRRRHIDGEGTTYAEGEEG